MLTFITASLILIMIPGPDQALITRNALLGGRAGGLFTMTGGALNVTGGNLLIGMTTGSNGRMTLAGTGAVAAALSLPRSWPTIRSRICTEGRGSCSRRA